MAKFTKLVAFPSVAACEFIVSRPLNCTPSQVRSEYISPVTSAGGGCASGDMIATTLANGDAAGSLQNPNAIRKVQERKRER